MTQLDDLDDQLALDAIGELETAADGVLAELERRLAERLAKLPPRPAAEDLAAAFAAELSAARALLVPALEAALARVVGGAGH